MRVLQVTRELPVDRRYGLGKSLAQLVEGLAKLGIASEAFCAGDLRPQDLEAASRRAQGWSAIYGAPLRALFEIVSRAWETGVQAARIAKAQGFDRVHCHDAVVAHGYVHAARPNLVPFGITQHAFNSIAVSLENYVLPVGEVVGRRIAAAERQVLEQARWVIFPTGLGSQVLLSQLGLLPTSINQHVIPHAKPNWQRLSTADARRQLDWAHKEQVLLAVGQLIPLKRMEWIVRALGSLAGWELVVLGEGDAQALFDAADASGARRPLITATDRPWLYYAAADAFASASATESFGMAHLEAMWSGLAIACTPAGGVPEVLGDSGKLLPDDAEGFAAGLSEFLSEERAVERARHRRMALERGIHWPDMVAVARRHALAYECADVRPIEAASFQEFLG